MLIYYTILTLKYSTFKNNFHCALSTEIVFFYFNHDYRARTQYEHETRTRTIERKLQSWPILQRRHQTIVRLLKKRFQEIAFYLT